MLKETSIALAIATASFSALATDNSDQQFASRLGEILDKSELAYALYLTCIKHKIEEDDLESFVSEGRTFLPYSEDQAREFLHGWPGKAWGFKMAKSAYVLTLTTNGICAVNAEKANRETAESDLKSLLDILYKGNALPLNAPDGATTPMTGWYVYHAGVKKYYSFSVVVGKGDNPPAEAVYSVQVSKAKAP